MTDQSVLYKSTAPAITLTAALKVEYGDGNMTTHSVTEDMPVRIESKLLDLVKIAQMFQRETGK